MRRAILLCLLVPTALACTQTEPCPATLGIDEDGIDETMLTFSVGDWVEFSFFNIDSVDHTLFLDGYDRQWTVPAEDAVDAAAFELHTAGDFTLTDAESGDTMTVRVATGDTMSSEPGKDSPAPLLVVLAALALATRRR